MSPDQPSPDESATKSPIQHVAKFFDAYANGPETFTLFEEHDLDYLASLLKHESSTINRGDKRRIRKVIKRSGADPDGTNLGTQSIQTLYHKPKNSGQYHGIESLQDLKSSLRNRIYAHDGYVTMDISNRGFTIIHAIAGLNGVPLPFVTEYVENRAQINAEHLKLFKDLKTVKYQFCYAISNPVHDAESETEFLKNLKDELIYVNEIIRHPDYPEFTIGKIIEIYSSFIMNLIYDYLVSNGICQAGHYSLNGDAIAFKPLKSFKISEIEQHILDETKIVIKLHH